MDLASRAYWADYSTVETLAQFSRNRSLVHRPPPAPWSKDQLTGRSKTAWNLCHCVWNMIYLFSVYVSILSRTMFEMSPVSKNSHTVDQMLLQINSRVFTYHLKKVVCCTVSKDVAFKVNVNCCSAILMLFSECNKPFPIRIESANANLLKQLYLPSSRDAPIDRHRMIITFYNLDDFTNSIHIKMIIFVVTHWTFNSTLWTAILFILTLSW